MRALKRRLRRAYGEWRIAPRRREVAAALQRELRLDSPPEFLSAGSRGHDSIYKVAGNGEVIGVLRLLNPWRARRMKQADLPFVPCAEEARIQREHDAYQKGAPTGITPAPRWRTTDALYCAYLPYLPLHDRLQADPSQAWDLICRVTRRLPELHALGVTHMDISLANVIGDAALERLAFIDFEYAPAPGLPPGAQRLYDHLRLVESTWKFIPSAERGQYAAWLALFATLRDADMRAADMARLAPALPNIASDAALFNSISAVLA